MGSTWRTAALAAAAACLPLIVAQAQEPVSFKGKTITMIIGTTAGAGTDLTGRLFAKFFSKHLPGQPASVSQNIPAAHGIVAMNFLAQQAKTDGTTVSVASSSQIDPATYRGTAAKYDPREMAIIGSVGSGDTAMVIRADALSRLYDKSKPPVTMGSVAGVPRTSMRMTVWGIEYLGWNAKWVVGYPGSSDLVLAMERGEIDMTAYPKVYLTDKLTDTAKFKVILSDTEDDSARPIGRADVDQSPSIHDAMKGKITDPLVAEAYDYWRSAVLIKWLALPPKTPVAIRDVYRAAFDKTIADPEFVAAAEQSMPGYTIVSAAATERIIGKLASTSKEALGVMDELMRKQGLNVAKAQARGEGG